MRLRQRIRFWPTLIIACLIVVLLATVFLVNVSKAGRAPSGCPIGCALSEIRDDKIVRIMSLNVLHGYPEYADLRHRMSLIAREIQELDVDIVALQEVPSTRGFEDGAHFLALETGMNYLYLRANGNRPLIGFEEGIAILSKYDLVEPSFTELGPRAGFFEHRVALGVTSRTPQGDLDIVVTHLTNGDPELNFGQTNSLEEFVRSRRKRPVIVAGDFNASEDSAQIAHLSSLWTDVYRAYQAEDPGLTCCVNNLKAPPGEPLEERIDYVFLSQGTEGDIRIRHVDLVANEPRSVKNGWQWLSDHIGLVVTVEFSD
jgi:endonuclease/exonuclease/phosphatase family metal-dependent hydrolase